MALVVKEIRDFNLHREIVYSIDVCPNSPLILIASYSEDHNVAFVRVFNTNTLALFSNVLCYRVWCAKFFKTREWIVAGDELGSLSFTDYVTETNYPQIEFAHNARVCSVDTHRSRDVVISSSTDTYIKVWELRGTEWWVMIHKIEDHLHAVKQVVFRHHDAGDHHQFASVSVDKCMKICSTDPEEPNISCTHMKGVNCVAYTKDRLLTGSADGTATVWQENGQLVRSFGGHYSVKTVCYHSELGVIITGSEEGALIWDATTFNPIKTRDLAKNVLIVSSMGSKRWVIGGKSGAILVKLSRRPVTLIDKRSRIFWYRNDKIQLHDSVEAQVVQNGGNLDISMKDVIACDVTPRDLKISPDEGFLAVCDGDQFVILRTVNNTIVCSGPALDFMWISESVFAVKESALMICFYKHSRKGIFFGLATYDKVEKIHSFDAALPVERIFGGTLYSICYNGALEFYDPVDFKFIRRFDVHVRHIYWAEYGRLIAIVGHDYLVSFYKFTDGIAYNEAFEYRNTIRERRISSGIWVEELFICIDSSGGNIWKLCCCGADGDVELADLHEGSYIVGHHPTQNGEYVYVVDRNFNVTGYILPPPEVYVYQGLVMSGDTQGADEILASIPDDFHNVCASILERHGNAEEALIVEGLQDEDIGVPLLVMGYPVGVGTAIGVPVQCDPDTGQDTH